MTLNQSKHKNKTQIQNKQNMCDDVCSICLCSMNKTRLSTLKKCPHVFHIGCITEWLSEHETCPICRKKAEQIKGPKVRDLVSHGLDNVTTKKTSKEIYVQKIIDKNVRDKIRKISSMKPSDYNALFRRSSLENQKLLSETYVRRNIGCDWDWCLDDCTEMHYMFVKR